MIVVSKERVRNGLPTRRGLGGNRHEARPAGTPKVMLLVETSRNFGREFLSGVGRYARRHGPWSIRISLGDFDHDFLNGTEQTVDGIIGQIPSRRFADAIVTANVPTIALGLSDQQLLPNDPLSNLPDISSDPNQIAQLATDFFLERRLSKFAYVGVAGSASSRLRDAFLARLRATGLQADVFDSPRRPLPWERELPAMTKWLLTLPTPVGLLACNDDRGRQVLEACRAANLRVPEDVAVLGVENDAVFCELSDPPLSSISLNAEGAGYRTAELLDDMMSGRAGGPRRVPVEAVRVVKRRSSEVFAIEDPDVRRQCDSFMNGLGFDCRFRISPMNWPVSRRFLERRFRSEVGRTLLDEIHQVRLDYAKSLLVRTSHPVAAVAAMSGFGTVAYFCHFFRERTGMTPRKYRSWLTLSEKEPSND